MAEFTYQDRQYIRDQINKIYHIQSDLKKTNDLLNTSDFGLTDQEKYTIVKDRLLKYKQDIKDLSESADNISF